MPSISVNGTDLFYTEQGTGTPLLLIHGTGMNAAMWGDAFDQLARQYRVIGYDRRGHSRSPAMPTRDYHQHAEDGDAAVSRVGLIQRPSPLARHHTHRRIE